MMPSLATGCHLTVVNNDRRNLSRQPKNAEKKGLYHLEMRLTNWTALIDFLSSNVAPGKRRGFSFWSKPEPEGGGKKI